MGVREAYLERTALSQLLTKGENFFRFWEGQAELMQSSVKTLMSFSLYNGYYHFCLTTDINGNKN